MTCEIRNEGSERVPNSLVVAAVRGDALIVAVV
jgi:hypothetical protein